MELAGEQETELLGDQETKLLNDCVKVEFIASDGNGVAKTKTSPTDPKYIELNWRNLSYRVHKTYYSFNSIKFRKTRSIEILKNTHGSVVSGRLTAVIGPSGAGKTTLLECLAGRRSIGVSGSIRVFGNSSVKIAFNSQQDQLLGQLSLRETLLFASKLKNFNLKKAKAVASDGNANVDFSSSLQCNDYHTYIVNNLLEELGLVSCAEVRVANCSGGQLRRLNIALELVSNPNIIILDEPTSGLDSSSSLQCVALLRKLAHNNRHAMAIMASIHQPSARLLSYFDHLYILSIGGQCIYNGPTQDLVDFLARFSLNCPQFHNPADYVIEVGTGDHGQDAINRLALYQELEPYEEQKGGTKISKIYRQSREQSNPPHSYVTWLLFQRAALTSIRDPLLSWLRFLACLMIIGLISMLYHRKKVGVPDGCIEIPSLDILARHKQHASTGGNIGFIFFSLIFVVLAGKMPMILTFPLEMGVFIKERSNGWYSCGAYYIAKSLADLPFQVIFPIMYTAAAYYITEQINEVWRFAYYILVMLFVSAISQSFGLLVGAFYVNNINAAVFAGAILTIPILLFAGLFVRIASMPAFLQPISYFSYFRLSFEAILVALYGFGRCPQTAPIVTEEVVAEKLGDAFMPLLDCIDTVGLLKNVTGAVDAQNEKLKLQNGSLVMEGFNLTDDVLMTNIIIMIAYFLILRIGGYLILLWRANRKE